MKLDLIVKNTTTNKYAGYDARLTARATLWHVKDGKVLGGDNGF